MTKELDNHDLYHMFVSSNDVLNRIDELRHVVKGLYDILLESARAGELNEGDLVFPHQCFHAKMYDRWLAHKKSSHAQTCESLRAKQYNMAVLAHGKKRALEVGFNAGFSAALILIQNPDLEELVCVDICQHTYTEKCFRFLEQIFGSQRIKLYKGNSLHVLPELCQINHYKAAFDFIHIDGGHGISIAQKDLHNIVPLFRWKKDSLLLFDDIQMDALHKIVTSFAQKHHMHRIDPLPRPCCPPLYHCAFCVRDDTQ